VEAARGVPSPNPWDPTQNYQLNFPYKSLSRSLELFGQKMGFRAILWHQGETDSKGQMTQPEYFNYLVELIKASRKDANQDIPWIVAQATRGGGCDEETTIVSPEIRAAQKQVSETPGLSQVFAGPNTDEIEVPRNPSLPFYNCVHFSPAGFPFLAVAWTKSIDDAISNGMKFLPFKELPKVETLCGPQNSVVIKKANNFASGKWTDLEGNLVGSALTNLNVNTGVYAAVFLDSLGREYSIPKLEFKNMKAPNPPSIVANSDTLFCSNASVKLVATSGKTSYIWNTGSLEKEITVSKTSTFKVKTVDELGCVSLDSKQISTQSFPLPATPRISVMSPYYLTTGTRVLGLEHSWYFNGSKLSVGSDVINLHAKESGLYQAKFSYTYLKGPTCISDFSNQINFELPVGNGIVTYPNPSSKELFVQSKYELVGAKYVLYGLDGREMLQGVIDNSIEFVINVSGLAPAIYKLTIAPIGVKEILYKTIVIENR
jgi:hypothetical protein